MPFRWTVLGSLAPVCGGVLDPRRRVRHGWLAPWDVRQIAQPDVVETRRGGQRYPNHARHHTGTQDRWSLDITLHAAGSRPEAGVTAASGLVPEVMLRGG